MQSAAVQTVPASIVPAHDQDRQTDVQTADTAAGQTLEMGGAAMSSGSCSSRTGTPTSTFAKVRNTQVPTGLLTGLGSDHQIRKKIGNNLDNGKTVQLAPQNCAQIFFKKHPDLKGMWRYHRVRSLILSGNSRRNHSDQYMKYRIVHRTAYDTYHSIVLDERKEVIF